MEFIQLKYFKEVALTGSVSKAAENLHMTQPALSRSITRLEKELGAPLFDRRNRRRLRGYGPADSRRKPRRIQRRHDDLNRKESMI